MNPETEEWVLKAEGDWRTMNREAVVTDGPNYDAVCFHAQQCVEKYLKALLFRSEIQFPKVHDLGKLLSLLREKYPQLQDFSDKAAVLTAFAVEFRYPGELAEIEDSEEAVRYCGELRDALRSLLDL